MIKVKNNFHKGMTLIEVLVALGILSVVLTFVGGLTLQLMRGQQRQSYKAIIEVIAENYVDLMKSPTAWEQITTSNPNPSSSPTSFRPKDANGNDYLGYNPNNANEGFDLHGEPCTNFNSVAPNANCPTRFTFQWRTLPASCSASVTACQPAIEIQIDVEISTPSSSPLSQVNPSTLERTLQRAGSNVSVLARDCTSVGVDGVVIGFNATGLPICDRVSDIRAPVPVPTPVPTPTPPK